VDFPSSPLVEQPPERRATVVPAGTAGIQWPEGLGPVDTRFLATFDPLAHVWLQGLIVSERWMSRRCGWTLGGLAEICDGLCSQAIAGDL
jgi:hypothetical protein